MCVLADKQSSHFAWRAPAVPLAFDAVAVTPPRFNESITPKPTYLARLKVELPSGRPDGRLPDGRRRRAHCSRSDKTAKYRRLHVPCSVVIWFRCYCCQSRPQYKQSADWALCFDRRSQAQKRRRVAMLNFSCHWLHSNRVQSFPHKDNCFVVYHRAVLELVDHVAVTWI